MSWCLSCSIAVNGLATISPVTAQIVHDNTLPVNSSVTLGGTAYTINGGTVEGTNLFHSFREFSVPTGGEAFFNNAGDIQNIFSRVTGNSASNIDGLIRANGTANLFFLNPNGIIFGANASLNIGGSFVASTASSIKFADGTEFSAVNPAAPPLLTINVPIGLQFNGNEGDIIVRSGSASAANTVRESGDAGQLPETAQMANISGTPPNSIFGRLDNPNDVDLYQLFLPAGQPFQATTVGGSQVDTQLFLFDSNAIGLYANDDSQRTFQSTVPVSEPFIPTVAGNYYLGISSYGNNPFSAGGFIFNPVSGTPTSSGAGLPLSGWNNRGTDNGNYTIKITSGLSTGLQVQPGQTLALVGGQVSLEGAILKAPEGRVELAGVAGVGTVGLDVSGNAWSLNIPENITRGDISLTNKAFVSTSGDGAGTIQVQGRQVTITEGSQMETITLGSKSGGGVTVDASQLLKISGESSDRTRSGIYSETSGTGNAGNLSITTRTFQLLDGAKVSTNTRGAGRGGDLTVNASELVEVRGETRDVRFGSDLFAQTSGEGKAGNLTINTRQLLVLDGAQISASTFGAGDGGILSVNASESVQVVGTLSKLSGTAGSGIFAQTNRRATGNAGELIINTTELLVKDGAQIATGILGTGNGGRLTINSTESVQVMGGVSDGSNSITSGIFTQVSNFDATGSAGELTINTQRLLVNDGATISAATFAEGNGANLTINASESVELSGISANGIFPSNLTTKTIGKGDAGNLTINTGRLLIRDGATAAATTDSEGAGGTLTVNATESVQVIGTSPSIYGELRSSLSTATTDSGSAGDLLVSTPSLIVRDGARLSADTTEDGAGGNITVTANTVDVTNGGQLRTATAGSQDAGNITLLVQDKVFLAGTGSGLLANTTEGSTGNGGSIFIDPQTVIIRDGAQIAVDSKGTGEGGNIEIIAGSLILENQARLLAETASNTGGNITLKLQDLLLLRNNSQISTTAGTAQQGGDGGNITIDAKFIVGVPKENSDITANAFQGQGGNINITTQGIYGLKFRPRLTPLSDITASSEFGLDGEFQLDLLTDVDPSRGLAQLPINIVDASEQIDRRCTPAASTQERNSFTITGRGGLPPSPNDPLQNESIITNWVTLDSDVETKTVPVPITPKSSTPKPLVEAQGWMLNHKGDIVLTASALTATPQGEWFPEAECNVPSVQSQ